jgi:hypothetical protein
MWKRMA